MIFMPLQNTSSFLFNSNKLLLLLVPSSPPRNLGVRNVSSRSVVLRWEEPHQIDWNGDITQYTVSIY